MKVEFKKSLITGLLLTAGICFGQGQNCVYLASDVYPGSYGSLPSALTEYNGALYFCATGNAMGVELWKYENGASSMVADINPGLGGSMPNEFTVMGGNLYFSANNGSTGTELFRYDGASVSLVADINPGITGSFVFNLKAIGTELYFCANDGTSGVEPWKYDGTTVSLVADMNPGSASSGPSEIEGVGGNVYFRASSDATGLELWKYNGVTAVCFDLYPGTTGSDIGELTPCGSKLVFRATDGVNGYELWTYDGTTLVNLNVNPTSDFTPWELTTVGTEVLFRGFMGGTGYELWKFDGTSASLVMDIRPGAPNSNPNNLIAVGSDLYFAANNGTIGNELWKYDGTSAFLLADIKTGSTGSMPAPPIEKMAFAGANVFMIATNATSGNEVWMWDGTAAVLGKDIYPGLTSSNPMGLRGVGSTMYFMSDNGIVGGELWAWDPNADLTGAVTVYTCGNYTSPAGDLYTAEGVYNFVDTIPSIHCPGCDSLVTVDLTITSAPSSSIIVVSCNDYTSPGGTYYSTTGSYIFSEIVPSISCPGIDSTINIDLTIIDNLSTAVVVFSGVILSQQSGVSYQWLNCDAGYAPIPGAVDQDFIPTVSGNYACELTAGGGCSDTTACNYVLSTFGVGVTESEFGETISIFPNPVSGILKVSRKNQESAHIQIIDNSGKIVLSMKDDSLVTEIDMSGFSKGIYFIHLRTETGQFVEKVIKL